MKVIGIILIVLQVLSLIGGGFPIAPGGIGYALGYYLGFFAPGIIGVILLIKGSKKKDDENNDQ